MPGSTMRHPFRTAILAGAVASVCTITGALAVDPNCCCLAHPSPSCSDAGCSATVCAVDPYCCSTVWDATCAAEAAQLCGAAAPYCVDTNQNNTIDVCEGGGGGGGGGGNGNDCDGDGQPDTQRDGPQGKSSWVGLTTDTQVFETGTNWSLGRPGQLTFAEVALPYTQYYDALTIRTTCDNAVRSLDVLDGGSSVLHDLTFDLDMKTLRFAGPAARSVLVSPNIYNTFRLEFRNGTIDALSDPFTLESTGALQVTFGNIDLDTTDFTWKTALSWSADPMLLVDTNFQLDRWNWPVDAQGNELYADLRLFRHRFDFNGQNATFTVPDKASLRIQAGNAYDYTEIYGFQLVMDMEAGSSMMLDGPLIVGGELRVGGGLFMRPHCLPQSQGCQPSRLSVTDFVCGQQRSSYVDCSVDLSGTSGTTPFGSPVIYVTNSADVGGLLSVNDMSNGQPLLDGYSVPLIGANSFVPGGGDFDIVRVNGLNGGGLPNGFYVTTARSGSTINLEVRRGAQVASTPAANVSIPQAPKRSLVLDDGARTGIVRVVSVSAPTQGPAQLRIDKVTPQGTFVSEWAGTGLADPTDMDVGDIDGDGAKDVLVSYGTPGAAVAYRQVAGNNGIALIPLWQKNLDAGTRAECVAILPASGAQSLLPTSSGAAVGTSKNGLGGITTVDGSGTTTGTAETAGVPSSIRGSDIDNDDDADVVSGGSGAAALQSSGSAGFVQVIERASTGGFLARLPVATAGVPNAITIADLDNDGLKDVIASCDGISGSFPPGARPAGVVLRGAPGSGPGGRASMLRTPCPIDVGDATAQGTGVAVVDADADGKLDIALSWESTARQTLSGGAAVVPVRDPRATGGLSLGSQVNFASGRVVLMSPCGGSSLITFTEQQQLTGGVSVDKTDFAELVVQGDLDGDGIVGNGDLAILLLDFGVCPGTPCPSDLDGTGEVDSGDISFLLLLFN